jgi:RNA polymerase sigma-70 factor (ECF subfamily)
VSRRHAPGAEPDPAGPGREDRPEKEDMSAIAPALTLAPSLAEGGPLSREDEAAVIEACQRGDRNAFDALVVRHQRDVYRLCYRYVNNHEDASDLTQEVFLKAWRAIGRFRGQSRFSTWLYRIAVNACLNFRAARRATSELPEVLPDPRPGAGERLAGEERARRVREAVARLPEKQRATLILKVYNDLTHQEVARVLGSSVGTVKANLFHALGNLRKLMAGDGK